LIASGAQGKGVVLLGCFDVYFAFESDLSEVTIGCIIFGRKIAESLDLSFMLMTLVVSAGCLPKVIRHSPGCEGDHSVMTATLLDTALYHHDPAMSR
jgi:hypothetical protein